jgi:AraC-like DNA-binding protein
MPLATPSDRRDTATERMATWMMSGLWDGVELCRAAYRQHRFPLHAHHEVHLALIETGRYRFRRDGRPFIAEAGDFVLLGADEGHDGGADDPGGYSYRQILIPPGLWHETVRSSRVFRPRLPVATRPDAARLLGTVFAANGLGDAMLFDAALARLAGHIAGDDSEDRDTGTLAPAMLRRIVERLEADFAEPWTLAALADSVGTSRFVLSRSFRRTHGIGLHDWLMDLRLNHARRWIAAGMAPAQAAAAAGFADQSHLARRFKRTYGVTPGDFRAACTSVQDETPRHP